MKLTTISFMQTFPTGNFSNQKLATEIQLDDTDNPQEAFTLAKKIVNDAFERLNPQISWSSSMVVGEPFYYEHPIPEQKPDPKEDATQRMIRAINECSTISVLETFKLLASKNPIIQEAYDNKLKELS